jgi:hypothetical protein
MIVPTLILLILLTVVSSSLLYHKTSACCQHINNSSLLLNCINDITPTEPTENNRRLAMITYYSPNIVPYAAYALAINTAYAEQNGYEFFALSPETGSNFEPSDQRWNRVKILDDALDQRNGWLRDVEYLIWVDADLVMIDFDYKLSHLIDKYPNADIIISAERHAETGVANTGSFILKNTKWSRTFLKEWWDNYDHKKAHDQIFFDKLYKSKYPDVINHIVILPSDEINSTPPATIYQKSNNAVLHLMGQKNELREKSFKLGYQSICESYTNKNTKLPLQLGLTQSNLFQYAIDIFDREINDILNNKLLDDNISLNKFIEDVSIARENVIQIKIYLPHRDVFNETKLIYETVRKRTKIVEQNKEQHKYLLTLWHSSAVYGNDVLGLIPKNHKDEILKLYSDIEYYIYNLEKNISPQQIGLVKEMKLRVMSSKGSYYIYLKQYEEALQYLETALATLKDMGDEGNPVYGISPLQEIGIVYCMRSDKENVKKGVNYFQRAIDLQDSLLQAEQQLKEDHLGLAHTLIRASGCTAKFGDKEKSKVQLTRAMDILNRHPDRQAAESLMPAALNMEAALESTFSSVEFYKEEGNYSEQYQGTTTKQDKTTTSSKKKFMKRKKDKRSEL